MQNTTTAEQSTQPCTITLAPVSPALAALLHQLQAQIIREASEAVRDPLGPLWAPVTRVDAGDRITYRAENGKEVWTRRRYCPNGWGGPAGVPWHPSHWLLDAARVDQAGRTWALQDAITIQPHVTDDFGNIVPAGPQ